MAGRPRIEIDLAELRKLCEFQCTAEDCAFFFDCSVDTLDRRLKENDWAGFEEFSGHHQAKGRHSLRRWMWANAENGSIPMQIFLAKNMLGMRDNPVSVEEPVKHVFTFRRATEADAAH